MFSMGGVCVVEFVRMSSGIKSKRLELNQKGMFPGRVERKVKPKQMSEQTKQKHVPSSTKPTTTMLPCKIVSF